ncbi:MAG TPA: amidohydrolase [Vicinamibacterales bacterium]|nr:amidohydrolase [Vicinamibacterales bacterium]
MHICSRRTFLRSLGVVAAAPLSIPQRDAPQLVLHGGRLLTMNTAAPVAEAIAIAGERIIAVGTSSDMLALAGPRTTRVDLSGRTVVPGFIDAHSHPASAGRLHLREVDCDLRSIADIQAAIRKRAAETPKGKWVLGFKYDDTKTKEGRTLSRADLDAAAPDHPVRISHRGGHTAYVNSAAFDRARIDGRTPDPPGGKIDRDAAGQPSGRLAETATDLIDKLTTTPLTRNDYRAGVKLISNMLSRAGITSVHDAAGSPDDLRAYRDARAAGELSVRVYCLMAHRHVPDLIAKGIQTGEGDEWVRVGAMKMTCDGSISERTARLSEPYVGRPDDRGILVMDEAALTERALPAHKAGWQLGIHANGDVAIDIVLRLYERLQREAPRKDPRFRIEHCTLVTPALIDRMRALGVIPNPFSTYVYFHGEKMREYGAARLERMFAVRSFLDAGLRVTQTSDYPPGPFEPMMALQSSVTRTDMRGTVWGSSQRVTVEEALRVGTLHGAFASYEESLKGSLEPGKLADLVVLGRDPLTADPGTLVDIPIERTMAGGRWVYES